MSDLSREELRAHLSAVESQVRAALRIIAAESKSMQQAHGALRADLSSALLRLQSDMTAGHDSINGKIDRTMAEVGALSRQRRMTTAILAALVLIFGVTVGILAGGSWFFLQQQAASHDRPAAVLRPAPQPAPAAEAATAAKAGKKPDPEPGFIINQN